MFKPKMLKLPKIDTYFAVLDLVAWIQKIARWPFMNMVYSGQYCGHATNHNKDVVYDAKH